MFLATSMRSVVTAGTARRAMAGSPVEIAGKTGTAQLDEGMPHAWFAGFAPYGGDPTRRIAFAVVVEHGGYGGRVAAPIAREIVEAAHSYGHRGVRTTGMAISDLIERLGRTIFEAPFSGAQLSQDTPELAEIRLALLDEIKSRSHRVGGRRVFANNLVRVHLLGVPEKQAAAFLGDFFPKYFEQELKAGLTRANYRFPDDLRVEISTSPRLPDPSETWIQVETEAIAPAAEPPARADGRPSWLLSAEPPASRS